MDGNGYHRQTDKEDTGKEKLKPVEAERFDRGLRNPQILEKYENGYGSIGIFSKSVFYMSIII